MLLTVAQMQRKKYSFTEMRLYLYIYRLQNPYASKCKEYKLELSRHRALVKKEGVNWDIIVSKARRMRNFLKENKALAA